VKNGIGPRGRTAVNADLSNGVHVELGVRVDGKGEAVCGARGSV
jgi:hypothetical protein